MSDKNPLPEHWNEPLPGIHTCGQPSPEQLAAARDAGVRTVVDLCRAGECPWDEREVVESLGMKYVSIPIAGPGEINEDNAHRLASALADVPCPVLVHCSTGNRAGALLAGKLFLCDAKPLDEALEVGRRGGMTKIEPDVRACLLKCGPKAPS